MAQLIFLNDIIDRNQYCNPQRQIYDALTDFKYAYYVYMPCLDMPKSQFMDWLIENGTGMILLGGGSNTSISLYTNSDELNFAIEMRFVSSEPKNDALRVMQIDYKTSWYDEKEPYWRV